VPFTSGTTAIATLHCLDADVGSTVSSIDSSRCAPREAVIFADSASANTTYNTYDALAYAQHWHDSALILFQCVHNDILLIDSVIMIL
jgi:hypothetical protein